jgi:hypothetical protein
MTTDSRRGSFRALVSRRRLVLLVCASAHLGCSSGTTEASATDAGAADSPAQDARGPSDAQAAGDAGGDAGPSSDAGREGGTIPGDGGAAAAAIATAENNAVCQAIEPFYWELGDAQSVLVSGSVGTGSSGAPVLATTDYSIASASKWIYGMYVVQARGSASNLMTAEIPFLNFTSGYTNMGSDTTTSQCPDTDDPDTVDQCLTLINSSDNEPFSYQNPATIGKFDYDSGHLENHARVYGSSASDLGDVGNVVKGSLGSTVASLLGSGVTLTYTEPLLAGGIYTNADQYGEILRNVLGGSLHMLGALGTNAVCTSTKAPCSAAYTPLPEVAWHYSIAHWVEDDTSTGGDGAFSSAGAFGFYPWIDATKQYYGVISREVPSGNAIQNGYASAQCGRLIREAWTTGVEQTGAIYPK